MTIDQAVARLLEMAAEVGGSAELFVRKYNKYTGEQENQPMSLGDIYLDETSGQPRQAVIDTIDL